MKNLTLRACGATLLAAVLALGLSGCSDDRETTATDHTGQEPGTDAPAKASAVSISEPWARGTVGSDDPSMSAAFMLIDNNGDEDVVLQSVASTVAERTELHEMAMVDGDMVMRRVEGDGITIEAGGDMLLQPGGYHVMLMDLTEELVPGTEIELTLSFSDGSTQTITVPVKEFTEEEGHYHEPGTPEHTHGGDDKVVGPEGEDGTDMRGEEDHEHGSDEDHDH